MENKKLKSIIILFTLILAIISLATAVILKKIGTQPIAPSAPSSKPKANTGQIPANITPGVACSQNFSLLSSSPTPPACQKPTPPTNISQNGVSKVIVKWNCDDPKIDCYLIKKFSSNPDTAPNGCTSCPGRDKTLENTFNLCEGDAGFEKNGNICTFTDNSQLSEDFPCLTYEITGKDYIPASGTVSCSNCKNDCTANNNTTCCFSETKSLDICGIPAQPTNLVKNKQGGSIQLTWKDNSAIEKGFKIYRRETGSDNFEISFNETAVEVLTTPSAGKGNTVQFVDSPNAGTNFDPNKIDSYVYSIRAYTYLCGCPPNGPTLTPTLTPIPTPTNTPPPSSFSCNRLEIVKIKKVGENSWKNWQEGMKIELHDKIKLKVTFTGTVDRVAVRVKVNDEKIKDYYSPAGARQTSFWETSENDADAIEINRLGNWEFTAFIKANNSWQ